MTISGAASSRSTYSPAVAQDVRVKELKAKIDDWSTCPTTDPQTKREIVGRLQQQLDQVSTSIEDREQAKQDPGSTIDLRV
ncbi:MAG TPA: hypothetical protein VHE55_03615 [Fimbriimonadaceae bacterium]|nr:hypothetical protein [Fimbriimonadaceae bacterium]